jgi:hypothetical protein
MTIDELINHPWIKETSHKVEIQFEEEFVQRLQTFNARKKLRRAITKIMAVNRLATLITST